MVVIDTYVRNSGENRPHRDSIGVGSCVRMISALRTTTFIKFIDISSPDAVGLVVRSNRPHPAGARPGHLDHDWDVLFESKIVSMLEKELEVMGSENDQEE